MSTAMVKLLEFNQKKIEFWNTLLCMPYCAGNQYSNDRNTPAKISPPDHSISEQQQLQFSMTVQCSVTVQQCGRLAGQIGYHGGGVCVSGPCQQDTSLHHIIIIIHGLVHSSLVQFSLAQFSVYQARQQFACHLSYIIILRRVLRAGSGVAFSALRCRGDLPCMNNTCI